MVMIAEAPPRTITLRLNFTPNRKLASNEMYRGKGFNYRAAKVKAEREKAWAITMERVPDSCIPDSITDPVHVTVTIHWGKLIGTDGKMRQARRLDWDSATALCKPMLDGALVDTGILADDRQIVAGTVLQAVAPDGEGFTVIEIERV